MMSAVTKQDDDSEMLDVELDHLPTDLRWREWMNRIEAVIFASAKPVAREDLLRVVGRSANIALLIEDIQADLKGKPYEIVPVANSWMFRTRPQYATAIRTAADIGEQQHNFSEEEMAVLCAVAYHQPIDRAGLADIFGKEISRDLLSRLRYKNLIGVVEAMGGKLIAVGDPEQLQPVSDLPGWAAVERGVSQATAGAPVAALSSVRRQRSMADRMATEALARGGAEIEPAIRHYIDKGALRLDSGVLNDPVSALAAAYYKTGTSKAATGVSCARLALAYTNREVWALNDAIRAQALARGEIDQAGIRDYGTITRIDRTTPTPTHERIAVPLALGPGDRVMLTRPHRALDLPRSAFGTVVGSLELHRGERLMRKLILALWMAAFAASASEAGSDLNCAELQELVVELSPVSIAPTREPLRRDHVPEQNYIWCLGIGFADVENYQHSKAVILSFGVESDGTVWLDFWEKRTEPSFKWKWERTQ